MLYKLRKKNAARTQSPLIDLLSTKCINFGVGLAPVIAVDNLIVIWIGPLLFCLSILKFASFIL